VYDDTVGNVLASRLGEEDVSVAQAIIEAMGKAKDTRQVQSLLTFANEPTLESTKLVWINTMMRLAPDQVLPTVRRWSEPSQKNSRNNAQSYVSDLHPWQLIAMSIVVFVLGIALGIAVRSRKTARQV
jgi:magnesium-transporting ATPase (P-type)